MATGNFYNRNASKIFAQRFEEDFEYEDFLENLRYAFKEKFNSFVKRDDWERDGLRSYCGKIIGEVSGEIKSYSRYDLDIYVEFELIVRSGYYDGINLDWEATVYVNGESLTMDEIEEGYFHYNATPMEKRYNQWIEQYVTSEFEKLQEEVESIYSEWTINLVRVARFSNGEEMYERVS
jgi:hypothetical protein